MSDTVFISVQNTCRKSKSEHAKIQLGDVKAVPNPTSGIVTFVFPNEIANGRIEIADPLGKIVKVIDVHKSSRISEVDLSNQVNSTIEYRVFEGNIQIGRGMVVIVH